MKKFKKRSFCGISSLLDIFGDKWSFLIVRDILFNGKSTYGEFLASEEKIATNILADRLALLESQGIISSSPHPDSRVKIVYRLTEKGEDLLPLLLEMVLWGDAHLEISERGKELARQLRKDRRAVMERILKRVHDERKAGS